jgi:hypothetical protein
MWFAASGAIGRITPNGKVTLFPTDFCPNVSTCDLVAGPDGSLFVFNQPLAKVVDD